ncbi:carboxymuconolactone decarboxylase family protein [Trichlorobacter lovleyi]|uniref:carboxymuconolactone decarboxylase family protein n=1 Tax=Trichlorobacter lovleyi TaxID=313985 RepID=UPI003D1047E7
MSSFKIHNVDSAPEGSKEILANYKKRNGMIPNLFGVLAEAPDLLEAYVSLHQWFQSSSLNAEELTVVWQTINVEHNCTYCVPAHTGVAKMMKVDPALTEALRNQEPMPTDKLQVLQNTTLAVVRKRGELSKDEVEAFYAAGYGQRQLLEIILGLSQKVISNYVNHIAETPIDRAFEKFAWEKK